MGVIIKIKAIETKTKNGMRAYVTGIDMTSGDPLYSYFETQDGNKQISRWGLLGNKRDGSRIFDLDIEQKEIKEILQAAKTLGARLT